MPWNPDPWKTWQEGDLVSNGTDRGEIFATFSNAAGKRYPKVRILTGKRAGQQVWPWESPRWNVALDFEPKTHRQRCRECGRQFWAPSQVGHCRECIRKEEAEDSVRSSTNTGSRTFSRTGAAPAFTPAPEQSKATEEQRAEIERWRRAPGDEPF